MIYFLVPMYNEEGNLATLHQNLNTAPIGDRVPFYVFSDDGSSDRSVEMVKEIFPEGIHQFIMLRVQKGCFD